MDIKVKGISWVGNVYQKFETMCLEVEDVVCQETAKYVETQVKTVGSSVKKFYSEVLQDLLPPSPKSEGSDSSLEQKSVFGTSVKPKISIEEESAGNDSDECQEQTGEIDICRRSAMDSDNYPIKKRLHPVEMSDAITSSGMKSEASSHDIIEKENHLLPSLSLNPDAANSVSPVVQTDNVEICGKSLLPTETGSTVPPMPDALELATAAGKGTSEIPSPNNLLCDRNQKENHLLPSVSLNPDAADSVSPVVQTDDVEICGKSHSPTETGLSIPSLPDAFEFDSAAGKGTSEVSSPNNLLCDRNIHFSMQRKTIGTSFTERVFDSGCAAHSSSSFQEGKAVEDGLPVYNVTSSEYNVANTLPTPYTLPVAGCSWTEPEHFGGVCTEITVDYSGLDECNEIVELTPETVDEFDTANLEESCIVVDRKEIPFATPRVGKHRSYKKKIRDALASRARSAHKQEYEQLAIWHGHSSNQPKVNSSSLELSTSRDTGESEWELL